MSRKVIVIEEASNGFVVSTIEVAGFGESAVYDRDWGRRVYSHADHCKMMNELREGLSLPYWENLYPFQQDVSLSRV